MAHTWRRELVFRELRRQKSLEAYQAQVQGSVAEMRSNANKIPRKDRWGHRDRGVTATQETIAGEKRWLALALQAAKQDALRNEAGLSQKGWGPFLKCLQTWDAVLLCRFQLIESHEPREWEMYEDGVYTGQVTAISGRSAIQRWRKGYSKRHGQTHQWERVEARCLLSDEVYLGRRRNLWGWPGRTYTPKKNHEMMSESQP